MAERSRSRRRVRQDIILAILQIAKDGTKKTNIMYKAKLSFSQLRSYLEALKKAGYISEESGIWKTTEKGLQVIEACKICHNLIDKML
jgi:predicted transcriptional regulator